MKPKRLRYRCADCPRIVDTERIHNPPAYCKSCRKARSQPTA